MATFFCQRFCFKACVQMEKNGHCMYVYLLSNLRQYTWGSLSSFRNNRNAKHGCIRLGASPETAAW